jgi:hypothetical protein
MTMTLISTVTVGSGGAASISLTSIPQTFTDLLLQVNCRAATATGTTISFYVNNNGANIYSQKNIDGDGGSTGSNGTSSTSGFNFAHNSSTQTANTFGNSSIYIPNYTGSTNKWVGIDSVASNNTYSSALLARVTSGFYASTAAITQLDLLYASGNLAQYSTVSLYGILKGSGGATVS